MTTFCIEHKIDLLAGEFGRSVLAQAARMPVQDRTGAGYHIVTTQFNHWCRGTFFVLINTIHRWYQPVATGTRCGF